MDAFFKYLKEPHILEDFKSVFDLSANFKYPNPSEAQKCKYFQEEFNVIFQRFYHYLRQNNTLPGKNDQEVEANIKNKVDQSDLVIEFDSWLEQEAGQFVIQDKAKTQTIQSIHSTYSNPPTSVPPAKYPPTPTPSRPPEPRPGTFNFQKNTYPPDKTAFNVQKHPPPVAPSPVSTKLIPALGNYTAYQQQQHPNKPPSLPVPRDNTQQLPITQQVPHQQRIEDKPQRQRFIEKLSEYMECPERLCIIKAELSSIMKKAYN